MKQRYKSTVLPLLLLAVGLLSYSPRLLSRTVANIGMVSFCNTLMNQAIDPDAHLQAGIYPVYNLLPRSRVEFPMGMLRFAKDVEDDNLAARWNLARIALAAGDARTAAPILETLTEQAEHNPWLYLNTLIAFIYNGTPADATSLYSSTPPPWGIKTISDTIALAYLEAGEEGSLKEVLELRPGDLYANYHLWKKSRQSGDPESTGVYSKTLAYFPLEVVSPSNQRLLDYAAMAVPNLLADGLWDRDKTLNVASYLVWQHEDAAGVEQSLKSLTAYYPAEPNWPFCLAELYHRRGDWQQAETMYRQVMLLDPTYAQAYLQMGMVAEAKSKIYDHQSREWLEEAADWYGDYHRMVPDDLLGLKKLVETYCILDRPGAAALRVEMEIKADDRRTVAAMLGVSEDSVDIGPNLVENNSFEVWRAKGSPEAWIASDMFNYAPFGNALFVSGADGLLAWDGRFGMRIVGLWHDQRSGQSHPRAGIWAWNEGHARYQEIPVHTGEWYMISLVYQSPDANLAIWVSEDPELLFANDLFLPTTHGQIHRYANVFESRGDGVLRPLIRYWGEGSVWFDDMEIRSVTVEDDVVMYPDGQKQVGSAYSLCRDFSPDWR